MGHGLPTELDRVRRHAGSEPILSVADVPKLRCPVRSPLAVFVACYTGAFDARADSLAEELLLAEQGPIAVVARHARYDALRQHSAGLRTAARML